jgi:hypothetical protein
MHLNKRDHRVHYGLHINPRYASVLLALLRVISIHMLLLSGREKKDKTMR